MMQDLAMHVLDIAYNSIRGKGKNISIDLLNSVNENRIEISIEDDGCGMSEEQLKHVTDPFYTTRTTRKIGLGVAFFKELADQCEGQFSISSKVDQGTKIAVSLKKDHWDTPPWGDLAGSLSTLIQADPLIDYVITYRSDSNTICIDTKEIKAILGDVSINEPDIILWVQDYIKQQIESCA